MNSTSKGGKVRRVVLGEGYPFYESSGISRYCFSVGLKTADPGRGQWIPLSRRFKGKHIRLIAEIIEPLPKRGKR